MYFDRQIRAQIFSPDSTFTDYTNELTIENLRIEFSVNKTFSSSTNTCSLRIYNLSQEKRNILVEEGSQVRLFAGYRLNAGTQLLFVGDVSNISHTFAQPEIISTLTCLDGETTLYNTLISVSFSERTPIRDVIQYIANRFSVNIAYFAQTENKIYNSGFSDTDYGFRLLDNACSALNLRWSIQNGDLYILNKDDGTIKPPVEISSFTGMVGIPERYVDKKQFMYNTTLENGRLSPGWKFSTLLKPDIIPGDRIRLISPVLSINGVFKVSSIVHSGDNYGDEFTSTFEVYP